MNVLITGASRGIGLELTKAARRSAIHDESHFLPKVASLPAAAASDHGPGGLRHNACYWICPHYKKLRTPGTVSALTHKSNNVH